VFRKLSQPIKVHLISHYEELKSRLGADFTVLDTQQSEKHHQVVGKDAFQSSNKQYGADLKQMCEWVVKMEGKQPKLLVCNVALSLLVFTAYFYTGTSKLHTAMLRSELKDDLPVKGSKEDGQVNEFRCTRGTKKQELEWDGSSSTWELQRAHLLLPFYHPCLSLSFIFDNLSFEHGQDVTAPMRVWLVEQLRVESTEDDSWHIRCNPKLKKGSRLKKRVYDYASTYSCVSLHAEVGAAPILARILAVICVEVDDADSTGAKITTVG